MHVKGIIFGIMKQKISTYVAILSSQLSTQTGYYCHTVNYNTEQNLREFPAFPELWIFIFVFTRTSHYTLLPIRQIHQVHTSTPDLLRTILILFSSMTILPNDLISSSIATKISLAFLVFSIVFFPTIAFSFYVTFFLSGKFTYSSQHTVLKYP
jgi:hypothetical protein